MTRVLHEEEVRRAIGYDREAIACIRQAYLWTRERKVSMPPVFHIDIDPNSAVDVKGAYVEGLPAFAIKMASGFNDNPKIGLPSSSSVILLISAHTGLCDAVFLDNGYLMNLRTALAGAVATHCLACVDAKKIGIVGTGVQARAQLEALFALREIDKVLVWGRNPDQADNFAAEMKGVNEAEVTATSELEVLVRQSDIITTTTPSVTPLIQAAWVQPGTHITAMGSDSPGKQELHTDVLQMADLVACDSIEQCRIGGELQHANWRKLKHSPIDLAEVIAGETGRKLQTDITICDQTGLGILDTAIALAAFQNLER